jgi:hypothetical protein
MTFDSTGEERRFEGAPIALHQRLMIFGLVTGVNAWMRALEVVVAWSADVTATRDVADGSRVQSDWAERAAAVNARC